MHYLLEALKDRHFGKIWICSAPRHLYNLLRKNKHVFAIRDTYLSGEITKREVEELVAYLLLDFKKGYQFSYNTQLAALLVGIGMAQDEFAFSFINDADAVDNSSEFYDINEIAKIMKTPTIIS